MYFTSMISLMDDANDDFYLLDGYPMSYGGMFPTDIKKFSSMHFAAVFYLFSVGALFAFIIIAISLQHSFTEQERADFNQEPLVVPYENKYPLSDDEETDCDEEEKKTPSRDYVSLKTLFVSDYTPNGLAIMRYNIDHEGFEYWCDDRTIKYDYLETVARKYVSTACCKELYVDRKKDVERQIRQLREEYEKKRKEKEEREQREKEEAELTEDERTKRRLNREKKKIDDDDDLFAKLKTPIEKNKEKFKNKMKRKGASVEELDEKTICPENSNKYIYKGRISELHIFKKQKKISQQKNINFSSFKNLFMSTKKDSDDKTNGSWMY